MHSIARDSQLQIQAIESINSFQVVVAKEKEFAISESNEQYANLLLGFACCLESIASEIAMSVQLKSSEPEKAWDHLIESQGACAGAMRAHSALEHLEKRYSHLVIVERHVFPPQSFMSAGFTCGESTCSICGEMYGTCPHLEGLPYMGVFCQRILSNPRIDHTALVDVPNDKRCRVTHIGVKGGYRNKMTGVIEPEKIRPEEEAEHLHTVKSILYHA